MGSSHGDTAKPQIILDNSHNGKSSAKIHIGLFRLICTNGLVVSVPGMYTNVIFRHMNVNFDEVKKLMEEISNQYGEIGGHITKMQDVMLNEDQKVEFAVKAVAHRHHKKFINKETGAIDEKGILDIINPSDLITPIRGEDKSDDLWSTFNIIQERMIKGGDLLPRTSKSGRASKLRPINNAKRNIQLNRTLWDLAENYMPSNNPEFYTLTTNSGETKTVEVIEELEDNFVKVKPANSKSTFAISRTKLN